MMLAAVSWHAVAGCKRVMRGLSRYRVLRWTQRAATARQHELNRYATLLEALERWRLPVRCAALMLSRVYQGAVRRHLVRWCACARLLGKGRKIRSSTHACLVRFVWRGWRRFCTLPERYDRLLAPMRAHNGPVERAQPHEPSHPGETPPWWLLRTTAHPIRKPHSRVHQTPSTRRSEREGPMTIDEWVLELRTPRSTSSR